VPFKLNPLTGELDLVSIDDENFSYNNVAADSEVEIPENQQMIVFEDINVDGELTINGDLVIFDNKVINRIIDTDASETINVELFEVVKQTEPAIVTSFSSVITGSRITIVNSSVGTNTLNITIQGEVNPIIYSRESFSIIYNGTDWDVQ